MRLAENQHLNNSKEATIGRLINFVDFDSFIIEELEKKMFLSHKEIKESDFPTITDSLREWLIKRLKCFTVRGFYRPSNLSIWYDNEALIEEFDDLFLKFKDHVIAKGLELDKSYVLTRYKDNLNFLIVESDINNKPGFAAYNGNQYQKEFDDLEICLKNFKNELETKLGHLIDVDLFIEKFNLNKLDEIVYPHIKEDSDDENLLS